MRIDPEALELAPLVLDAAAFQSLLPVQNYHVVFADDPDGNALCFGAEAHFFVLSGATSARSFGIGTKAWHVFVTA
ncbi:MAG: hypothetical protein ACT4OK_22705 [Gemmobacter sp.]